MRHSGTVARGIRMPIIREGDDLAALIVDSLLETATYDQLTFADRDIVAITEAIVARAQGNYASVDQIATEAGRKFPSGHVGLVFPITSRNRFAMVLKGIARGLSKITLLLSYPTDEVGNAIVEPERFDGSGVNPYTDVLSEAAFYETFGENLHPFTGVDYIRYYREIVTAEGCEIDIWFGNDPKEVLKYTKEVLACDVHTREKTLRALKKGGAEIALSLADLLVAPVDGSGWNEAFGLLGSNTADAERVKLFPREPHKVVREVQASLKEATGKAIEVMIYGDGAFKDPAGKIWELADPVVSPAYTEGLEGVPSEVKLKYLADTLFADLSGEELQRAMVDYIREKDSHEAKEGDALGTTPRRLTDLLGSLADLVSGSGDKGTPVVLIQGYFDSLASGFNAD